MNGLRSRAGCCGAPRSASTSLPVPVSPEMRIEASVAATRISSCERLDEPRIATDHALEVVARHRGPVDSQARLRRVYAASPSAVRTD